MARLKDYYQKELVAKLKTELGLDNIMEVPAIKKITLNMGVGDAAKDKKIMTFALNDLTAIAGQKPVVTKSKNQLLVLKFVMDGLLVLKLRYVAIVCMNF